MKLPSIFKIWNSEHKRWHKSYHGLQMWAKIGSVNNILNHRHNLEGLQVKEFYLLPKEDLYLDSINDYTCTSQYFNMKKKLFLEEFGEYAHVEMSSVIDGYDRDKASLVSIVHWSDPHEHIAYVFKHENIYYRFCTMKLQNELGRKMSPAHNGFVEPKFIVTYKFVTKE